jgi:hypothetical protein
VTANARRITPGPSRGSTRTPGPQTVVPFALLIGFVVTAGIGAGRTGARADSEPGGLLQVT